MADFTAYKPDCSSARTIVKILTQRSAPTNSRQEQLETTFLSFGPHMAKITSKNHLQSQRPLVRKDGKLSMKSAAAILSEKTITNSLGATAFLLQSKVNLVL